MPSIASFFVLSFALKLNKEVCVKIKLRVGHNFWQVMRAQEAEYERHLQNMLKQEEERNKQYLDKLKREERQRDIKRKLAMFRQNQNLELRQHVRLSKLKQKFTAPFKYSYFPVLKVNYMKIVMNSEQAPRKPSGATNKAVKKKKIMLKRV